LVISVFLMNMLYFSPYFPISSLAVGVCNGGSFLLSPIAVFMSKHVFFLTLFYISVDRRLLIFGSFVVICDFLVKLVSIPCIKLLDDTLIHRSWKKQQVCELCMCDLPYWSHQSILSHVPLVISLDFQIRRRTVAKLFVLVYFHLHRGNICFLDNLPAFSMFLLKAASQR
jgi:hypothetical protein